MQDIGSILLNVAAVALPPLFIVFVLSAPCVCLGYKRIRWRWWELLVLVLPFLIWGLLQYQARDTERLLIGNVFFEPSLLAVVITAAIYARIGIGSLLPQRACAACLLTASCVAAAVVFFVVPPMPP